MRITGLDHVNIRGPRELLERCRHFYVEVLGLTEGHRPPFRRHGFWLYAGERPIVHLTEGDGAGGGRSAVDHFALRCEGLDAAIARLEQHGIAFSVDRVPETGDVQIFLKDPADIGVELNFCA